jgi:hypothetical protein
MPRLPNDIEHTVGFLYQTRADAEANARLGGTCSFVGLPGGKDVPQERPNSPFYEGGMYSTYAVSNRHVVWNASAPVIRINTRRGSSRIIDLDCTEWIVHPDGDDLAVAYIGDKIDSAADEMIVAETDHFILESSITEHGIGMGDDVFMIGRFINLQGDEHRIAPSARFGSISMMPQSLWNPALKRQQLSFAVEMRSRTGFSGSPVTVYRTPPGNPFRYKAQRQTFWGLLGINWGYVLDENGDNTWLNGVVPAWKILDVLNMPVLKTKHEANLADWEASQTSDEDDLSHQS